MQAYYTSLRLHKAVVLTRGRQKHILPLSSTTEPLIQLMSTFSTMQAQLSIVKTTPLKAEEDSKTAVHWDTCTSEHKWPIWSIALGKLYSWSMCPKGKKSPQWTGPPHCQGRAVEGCGRLICPVWQGCLLRRCAGDVGLGNRQGCPVWPAVGVPRLLRCCTADRQGCPVGVPSLLRCCAADRQGCPVGVPRLLRCCAADRQGCPVGVPRLLRCCAADRQGCPVGVPSLLRCCAADRQGCPVGVPSLRCCAADRQGCPVGVPSLRCCAADRHGCPGPLPAGVPSLLPIGVQGPLATCCHTERKNNNCKTEETK